MFVSKFSWHLGFAFLGLAILTAIDTAVNKPGTAPADLIKGYHAAIWGALGLIALALIISVLFLRGNVIQKELEAVKKGQEEDVITVVQRQMEEGKAPGREAREEEDNTVIGEEDITNNTLAERK